MDSQNFRQKIEPQNSEERLIYWAIIGTWGFWVTGVLYIVGAVVGLALITMLVARGLDLSERPFELRNPPASALIWIAGMLAMGVALVIAHLDYELGTPTMIKSIFGWMKGWAFFAVFPLVGAMLSIRPAVITRATGILAVQSLVLIPIFFVAPLIGLPKDLYVSPLSYVIGTGQEFFDVSLYTPEESTGRSRFRFFSPWPTAAAFVAGLGLVQAFYERDLRLRMAGIVATVLICWMAGSRLSAVALPAILILSLLLANVSRPAVWIALAIVATLGVVLSDDVVHAYQDVNDAFNAARADSSRVRATLGNIAVHRWWSEAPIFGHGILDPGGQAVQRMLIGSHHTWWGLLFVKGAVGFIGLALPLAWSITELVVKSQRDRVARVALGILMSVILFSLGDNIEIIAYLVWPSLLFLGTAFRRRLIYPTTALLGAH